MPGSSPPRRRFAHRSRASGGILLALLGLGAPLTGQVDGGRCTITGRVLGSGDAPLEGAAVQARIPEGAGASVEMRTDAAGRYCLRLPGAGEYVIQIAADAHLTRSVLVEVPAPPFHMADVVLSASSVVLLDEVIVQAPLRVPPTPRRGAPPGGEMSAHSVGVAMLHPVTPGDLASSAGVSGRHVPVDGQNLSIDGQSPLSNRTTLDGAGHEAGNVPAEGLAAAGILAHPYDVSRGGFTGGEIAGRTMGGTNVWGGAFRFSAEPHWLSPGGGGFDTHGVQPRQLLVGGGGGGALAPGRLFIFASGQASELLTANIPFPGGPAGSLVPPDTLQRFRSVLSELGLPPVEGGENGRIRAGNGLLRFDYLPHDDHAVMLRLDGRSRRSPAVSYGVRTAPDGVEESSGGGAMMRLTSRPGRAENELVIRRSTAELRLTLPSAGPRGEVWMNGGSDDYGGAGTLLRFGGEPFSAPEEVSTVEVSDRLQLRIRDGLHEFQVGGSWQREDVWRASRMDRLGTFVFRSVADLQAGRAARFTRSLGERGARVTSDHAAVFAGHTWRPSPGLRVITGLRAERSAYGGPRTLDSLAGALFGLERVPSASRWWPSPRAGFTWSRSGATTSVSALGGSGVFRGAPPTRLLAAGLSLDGGPDATELVCVGESVPVPRWDQYHVDSRRIPEQCLDGTATPGGVAPAVTGFSRGYGAPSVWHSSIGATWLHHPTGTGAELRVSWSRGEGEPLAQDRNLADESRFRIPLEGDRPVYVPSHAIEPATGLLSRDASRIDPRLGIVAEVNGSGRSSVAQLGMGLYRLTGSGLVELYYTYSRARDQSTGLASIGGGWASTGNDPRRPEWGTADFAQRHAVQLLLSRPLRRWAHATMVGRLLSGTPYTPVIDGDVNGDGLANDRAFVFDPATVEDDVLARDLSMLLRELPGSARSCLLRQVGRVAARNSCRSPWNAHLDVQLNLFPGGPRDRRTSIAISAENVTSLIDHLLHGRSGLRGWGQYASADPVLLRVAGFDPSGPAFRYAVNPGFGPDAGRRGRIPFAVRLRLRLTVGADPATQALVAQVVMNHDRIEPDALRGEMVRTWPNVPALVLAHDSVRPMGLTAEQVEALLAASAEVAAQANRLAAALAEGLIGMGGTDRARIRAALNEQETLMAEAAEALERGRSAARSALTAEQWERLPRGLRAPVRVTLPLLRTGGVRLLPEL
jgi:hypothetical protein